MNLLCGCIGIYFVLTVQGRGWAVGSLCIGLAAIFDFLDGFTARLLKVHSDLGKQLDSLADLVTFGVLPGFILFEMLTKALQLHPIGIGHAYYIAFLIPIFSAIRLARFNIDTRQSEQFIGVPTPANSLLIGSFPMILRYNVEQEGQGTGLAWLDYTLLNPWFLIGIAILMSYLMVAELPLFALKFKHFKWKDNETRYLFLIAGFSGLVIFGFLAVPFLILLYVLLSVFIFARKKN